MIAKLDRLQRREDDMLNAYANLLGMVENTFTYKKLGPGEELTPGRIFTSKVRLAIARTMQEDDEVLLAMPQMIRAIDTNPFCGECYIASGHNYRDLGYLSEAATNYVSAIHYLLKEDGIGSVGVLALAGVSVMGTDSFESAAGERGMRSIMYKDAPVSTRVAAQRALSMAYLSLATLYHEVGAYAAARTAYEKAASHVAGKSSSYTDFALASLGGDGPVPSRAPRKFIEDLFDALVKRFVLAGKGGSAGGKGPWPVLLPVVATDITDDYDAYSRAKSDCNITCARHTMGLHAAFPEGEIAHAMLPESTTIADRIRDTLEHLADVEAGDRWLDVVDLGCGTGAIGARVRDLADFLLGIDVSSVSLEAAARRSAYDKLERQDIVPSLLRFRGIFDAVLMGDLAPYLGNDLGVVLDRAVRALRADGVVIMSFDIRADSSRGLMLEKTGRWVYSESHVANIIAESGLVIVHKSYFDVESRAYSDLATFSPLTVRVAIYGMRRQ